MADSTSSSTNLPDLITGLFSQSNMGLVILILVVYFVVYFGLGMYFNKGDNPSGSQLALSRTIDFLVIGIFLFVTVVMYISLSTDDKNNLFVNLISWTKTYFDDPKTIIELIFTTIIFYIFVYLLRVPMTAETRPGSIGFIENKLWVLLVIQLILDFFKYVFGIHIIDLLFSNALIDWFKNVPDAPLVQDVSAQPIQDVSAQPIQADEVFNISNNLYTYDDAQAICSAYDAQLATYDQIEDTYNNGGEWCNYGWSSGQMALFPTQKNTWDTLQNTDNHKNDCGRPGINGGVISNPYMKFGVNCYGKKPKATSDNLAYMDANKNKAYPKTLADQVVDAKVKFWKDNAANMLNINSYNKDKWSEY